MHILSQPHVWARLTIGVALGFALVALPAQAQYEMEISNGTGHGYPPDEQDAPIAMRIGCDGAERDLAPKTTIGCRDVTTVTVTPVGEIADSVRIRVMSGPYVQSPEGIPFSGTVSFETRATNPACDPNYDAERVLIGGHIDDRDWTDLQVVEGDVWYVTVQHTCVGR